LGAVDVRLVAFVEFAECRAAPVEQRFPACGIAPSGQLVQIGAFLLVVVEGVIDAFRVEPATRLLHSVAVGDAVEVCGHGPSSRLKRWMRGCLQANSVYSS